MSRREYFKEADHYEDIITITATTTTELDFTDYYNKGCRYMGIFMVGGGGSGSGDYTRSGHGGGGGGGGQVVIKDNIPIEEDPATGEFIASVLAGAGGQGGTRNKNGEKGKNSEFAYQPYPLVAKGGYGGYSTMGLYSTQNSQTATSPSNLTPYPRIENAAYGGQGGGGKEQANIAKYYNTKFDLDALTYFYSIKGEDGMVNPFESGDDKIYYGGAGGAGYNVSAGVDLSTTYPNSGGKGGGGRGGYGTNNTTSNKGQNATFYGGGGGGGAFSSNHTNSLGGSGYQGIVIIYIYKAGYNPS